jgi:hypothetical protein
MAYRYNAKKNEISLFDRVFDVLSINVADEKQI